MGIVGCIIFGFGMIAMIDLVGGNPCDSKTDCSSCLQSSGCAWCNDPKKRMCFMASKKTLCKKDYTYYFENVLKLTKENDIFSKSNNKGTVFISPEKAFLQLTLGTPINITIKAKIVKDQPIDFYWTMDANFHMWNFRSDSVEKIRHYAGFTMLPFLRRLSSSVAIGYGTYMIKQTRPYAVPSFWPKAPGKRWPAHPFLVMVRLTSDVGYFQRSMKDIDAALMGHFKEGWMVPPLVQWNGGSDALMQGAVCKRPVGWRTQARKLILLCANMYSFWEPDGKKKAYLKPNDGKCHVNSTGWDVGSSKMDFPSKAFVKQKLEENIVNPVFAIYPKYLRYWSNVAREITSDHRLVERGRELAFEIDHDKIHLEKPIAKQLEIIKRTIELRASGIAEVGTVFSSDCNSGKRHKNPRLSNRCYDLEYEKEVTFEAQVVLRKCPNDPNMLRQNLIIQPEDSDQKLTVDVRMICDCCTLIPGYEDDKCPRSCLGLEECVWCLAERKWTEGGGCDHQCMLVGYNSDAGIAVDEIDYCEPDEAVEGFRLTITYIYNDKGQVETRVEKQTVCRDDWARKRSQDLRNCNLQSQSVSSQDEECGWVGTPRNFLDEPDENYGDGFDDDNDDDDGDDDDDDDDDDRKRR